MDEISSLQAQASWLLVVLPFIVGILPSPNGYSNQAPGRSAKAARRLIAGPDSQVAL